MIETQHCMNLLSNLGLETSAECLESCLSQATKQKSTYVDFLTKLLNTEQDVRQQRSYETRLKLSRLPQKKDLDSFDFNFQPSLDEQQIRELATLNFAVRKENLVLLGPPGVGKSHLGMALCMEAIKKGLIAYFTTMDRLMDDLVRADLDGRLAKRWKVYRRPDLLMIDEIGYKPLDKVTGNLFFQLVCLRYEKGSLILTSNKGFSDWGELMGNTAMATAILDRLLHHAHVINIRGGSYRMKERKQFLDLVDLKEPIKTKQQSEAGQF